MATKAEIQRKETELLIENGWYQALLGSKVAINKHLIEIHAGVTAEVLLYWGHTKDPHLIQLTKDGFKVCIRLTYSQFGENKVGTTIIELKRANEDKPAELIISRNSLSMPGRVDSETTIVNPKFTLATHLENGNDFLLITSKDQMYDKWNNRATLLTSAGCDYNIQLAAFEDRFREITS